MFVLVAFGTVVAVALAVRLTVPPLRRRKMAAELRGDWWPRFEREFHAYASRPWKTAREAERGS
jgi:hypothetical protein